MYDCGHEEKVKFHLMDCKQQACQDSGKKHSQDSGWVHYTPATYKKAIVKDKIQVLQSFDACSECAKQAEIFTKIMEGLVKKGFPRV